MTSRARRARFTRLEHERPHALGLGPGGSEVDARLDRRIGFGPAPG